jgi:uncharacterized protein (TIGR02757 family)
MFNVPFYQLKEILEFNHNKFNRPEFIENDPISIPHRFTIKEDIEISAFLTSMIAWGLRKTIIKNAENLVEMMDNSPYDFILNFTEKDLRVFENFKHRTFNNIDCNYFLNSLKNIYKNRSGLHEVFYSSYKENQRIDEAIIYFRKIFFELPHLKRTEKHIGNIETGSACKKINMFLRWMVRKDNCGVDFGLWDNISPSHLYLPLDVHSARISRQTGLLKRENNDWKAVIEVTENLKKFDPDDPVKYDFALFAVDL